MKQILQGLAYIKGCVALGCLAWMAFVMVGFALFGNGSASRKHPPPENIARASSGVTSQIDFGLPLVTLPSDRSIRSCVLDAKAGQLLWLGDVELDQLWVQTSDDLADHRLDLPRLNLLKQRACEFHLTSVGGSAVLVYGRREAPNKLYPLVTHDPAQAWKEAKPFDIEGADYGARRPYFSVEGGSKILYATTTCSEKGFNLYKSTDHGTTWTSSLIPSNTPKSQIRAFLSAIQLQVDRKDGIHLVYDVVGPGGPNVPGILYAHSPDGKTFEGKFFPGTASTSLSLDDGHVYLARCGHQGLIFLQSDNDGKSWSAPRIIDTPGNVANGQVAAWGQHVVVVCAVTSMGGRNIRSKYLGLYCYDSSDGGKTWAPPHILPDEPKGPIRLSVGPRGMVIYSDEAKTVRLGQLISRP